MRGRGGEVEKSANDETKATRSFKYSLVNLRQVHVVFMTSLTIFTASKVSGIRVPRWCTVEARMR